MARRGDEGFHFTLGQLALLAVGVAASVVFGFFLGVYVGREAAFQHAPLDDLDAWPVQELDDEPNDAVRELSRCLQPMLDQLPPAAREALVRVEIDGQTQLQAARELGLSLSGMKSRVQRARRELKDLLEQCCVVDVDRRGGIADYHPPTGGCACATETSTTCN